MNEDLVSKLVSYHAGECTLPEKFYYAIKFHWHPDEALASIEKRTKEPIPPEAASLMKSGLAAVRGSLYGTLVGAAGAAYVTAASKSDNPDLVIAEAFLILFGAPMVGFFANKAWYNFRNNYSK